MVRCERFVTHYKLGEGKYCGESVISYTGHPVIYDRVEMRNIVEINTGYSDIDEEIVDELMNILNRKYLLKKW